MSHLHEKETYQIIGAAMEVHKELGGSFLEAVYREALEREFLIRNIPYVREQQLNIYYKENRLSKFYIADFVCFDRIIVELKALPALTNDNMAQAINYLKATDSEIGLLVNFGKSSLEYKRLIFESKKHAK
ncbi:MAG: GxxExxY protein [Prevotellaceae bacterium]|jgi:GxxExxY protein|nr:GxxExxY protein [Prevotellaceae bacterium]